MSGYPICWDHDTPFDGRADTCPYNRDEIKRYLNSNHYHWALQEPPTQYDVGDLVLERKCADRSYWIFAARDGEGRRWYVLVRSGLSPFDKRRSLRRWMYAESDDPTETPETFFARAYREQAAADMQI